MFSSRKQPRVKRGTTNNPDFTPSFCKLQLGDNPPYVFPFACQEQGWLFVGDMQKAGWKRLDTHDTVILTAPEAGNVVPFKRVGK